MRLLAVIAKGPAQLRTAWNSWVWRHILRAPRLRVHYGAQIWGDRHIHVGSDFRAGRLLWLEAVERYASQVFAPRLVLGDRVSCSDAVHIACIDSVIIGNDVLIGSKVHITDHNHGAYQGSAAHSSPQQPPAVRALTGRPVVIEERVFLADGVVVLPGSHVGAGTIVGANSVVLGILPPDSICVGTPARPIKQWDAAAKQWRAIKTAAACVPTSPTNDIL
jgi:lipopolysaccharide O-acetyltransferase